jgi:hypothetical protein
LIAEIAERGSIKDVAEDFNLDADSIKGALEDVATVFDYPAWKDVENSD